MRLKWLRLEFGMELAPDKMRMVRQFDHLHVSPVGRRSGNSQSCCDHRLFILSVKFVTMPVPLADLKCSVNLVRQGIRLDPASPRSQPHGSAQLLYAAQFAQLIDHAVRCRWIKLARVRLLQSNHIPGELDASRLHSQTNAEIRNFVLPRI